MRPRIRPRTLSGRGPKGPTVSHEHRTPTTETSSQIIRYRQPTRPALRAWDPEPSRPVRRPRDSGRRLPRSHRGSILNRPGSSQCDHSRLRARHLPELFL
jgi:hypothetical protein